MQIITKGIQLLVLSGIVLSCTQTPSSIQNKILGDDKYKKVISLIEVADSLAETDPDSGLMVIAEISNYPSKGMATELITAYANQIRGVAYISKGKVKEGFDLIESSHSFFLALNDSLPLAVSYKRKGYALRKMNKYDEAIKCNIEALTLSEEKKTTKNIAYLNNALGLLFMQTGNYENAINYLNQALKLYEQENDQFGLSKVLNNLGGTYYQMGHNVLSLENLEKAYEIKKKLGETGSLGSTSNNIGLVCLELKLYNKAVDYFNEAIIQSRLKKDKWGEANTLNNLARGYIENNAINTAKEILKKNKRTVESVNTPDLRMEWYNLFYKIYQKEGNSNKALEFYILYTTLKDSVFSTSKDKIIGEIQGKYESEKKGKEIEVLSKLRTVQESRLKMQYYIGFFLAISFLSLIIFSLLLLKRYRSNNKEHFLLKAKQMEVVEKNAILNKTMNEVAVKTEQLKKQRDLAKEQKNQIQHQKEEMTNSIRYAYRIQSAILESKELSKIYTPNNFTLFRPKDIVSGDFYWIREIENYSVFAVADCTGHGVPGAFMSLLGISFLNEIFSDKNKIEPHEILNSLRAKIISALHQNVSDPINNDGMDMSLLFIDHARKKILYSGANSSLFVIRKSELIEIAGDKMPVGFYYNMSPFTTHTLSIGPSDCIYLATDGFADQFGGPDGKKFRMKGLKNLLLQIGDKPLEQQKNILECSFDAWKGNNIQVDDVLILGIKV